MSILSAKSAAVAFLLALTTGCAHNIAINPTQPVADSKAPKVNKVAGLHISAADRAREVITPGGGGDKISYFPYKDLEGPMAFAIGRVYSRVESLPATDAATLAAKKVNIVFTPQLTTTSSSSSPFTWPPTDFGVTIKMKALDAQGATLWEDSVTGTGKAEFDEFKADFPLAARRASFDALQKLEAKLREKEATK